MVLYPSADEVRQRQQQAATLGHSALAQYTTGQTTQPNPYLSTSQQELLAAALSSQANAGQSAYSQVQDSSDSKNLTSGTTNQPATMNGANGNGLFMSPQQDFGDDFTPDLDYLDNDGFDFEDADLGGEMIGALPGSGGDDQMNGAAYHEKRKNSDDSEEGDAKRQEGEKGAKKPGRKPLTSEPTTKRKAQNRAAQRAFRERKEAHLKELETKVNELTKTQEADKHEKGILKAQVDRLQVELKEYRKRLPLGGGSGVNRSPPLTARNSQTRSNSNPGNYGIGNNFQFDFPKFGALPGSQIFGNQGMSNNASSPALAKNSSQTPPLTQSPTNGSFSGPSGPPSLYSRENSTGRSASPKSISGSIGASPSQITTVDPSFTNYSSNNNMHGFASTLPQMTNISGDPFGDLFSPSILKSANADTAGNYFGNSAQVNAATNPNRDNFGGNSTAGLDRVFQFNSASSTSDSASPSGSSQWNGNANSSCGTSPEPTHDSPANKPKSVDSIYDTINPLNATGTIDPTQTSFSSNQLSKTDYSIPTLDSFDPVLFGDYRDSNDPMLSGDFTNTFFDDALNPAPLDFASPSNLFGILQSPPQTNASLSLNGGASDAPTPSQRFMAQVDKNREGGDEDFGLPNAQQQKSNKLISCNNIWNQLQSNPDFQDGKFDLDGLCSELRAKARCSESGVMVDQDHVDAALRKLGKKDEKGKQFDAPQTLMFEQSSWDNVLKKLGNNQA